MLNFLDNRGTRTEVLKQTPSPPSHLIYMTRCPLKFWLKIWHTVGSVPPPLTHLGIWRLFHTCVLSRLGLCNSLYVRVGTDIAWSSCPKNRATIILPSTRMRDHISPTSFLQYKVQCETDHLMWSAGWIVELNVGKREIREDSPTDIKYSLKPLRLANLWEKKREREKKKTRQW